MEIKTEIVYYTGYTGVAARAQVYREDGQTTVYESYADTEINAYKDLVKELVKLLEQCNQTKPSP